MPSSKPGEPVRVDVLIVGGGPTGLIAAHVLLKAGLETLTIERYDKEVVTYGRACMLYSRSMEILDQLGLFESIAEIGYIVKGNVTYRGRDEFPSRGWSFIQKAVEGNTYFDYSFGIRQNILEGALRKVIHGLRPETLWAPARLLKFCLEPLQAYPVLAQVDVNGTIINVCSKYIIGADGARSTVRSVAQIPFSGITSPFQWIRLDAIVRTDMPAGRQGSVSVESATHGNILWTPTDNGRTRIGFICPPELYADKADSITAEAVIAETQDALKPFKVEFTQLDWWTVYNVGQRIAERFIDSHVILAGDAAHTHSSGAAQGMNAAIHDASNFTWKLVGVLKGWYTKAVLETYAEERKSSVERLIRLDKDISFLISGVIPAHFNAPPEADVHTYLDEVYQNNAAFTVGLGIGYPENIVNRGNGSQGNAAKGVRVGYRAPDAPLYRPGSQFPRRLQEFMPNCCRFWILVFAGGLDPSSEQPRLRDESMNKLVSLRAYIESPVSFANTLAPVFEFLTIVQGDRILQPAETLGCQPLGKLLYDKTGEVYSRYGIDSLTGAMMAVRPDGIVAFVSATDQFHVMSKYFAEFVQPVSK